MLAILSDKREPCPRVLSKLRKYHSQHIVHQEQQKAITQTWFNDLSPREKAQFVLVLKKRLEPPKTVASVHRPLNFLLKFSQRCPRQARPAQRLVSQFLPAVTGGS